MRTVNQMMKSPSPELDQLATRIILYRTSLLGATYQVARICKDLRSGAQVGGAFDLSRRKG